MDSKLVFGGLVALIVILLGVALVRPDGPSEDPLAVLDSKFSEAESTIAALEGRIDELQGSIDERVAAVEGMLDGVATTDVVESASAAQAEAMSAMESLSADLESRLSAVEGAVAEMGTRMSSVESAASEMASAVAQAPAATSAPSTEAAVVPASDASGFGPGQTALFADGALRIFVSRVMADEGMARLSVNGSMQDMAVGSSKMVPSGDVYCRVTLDSASGNRAGLTATCGDDLPPAEGATAGQTVLLNDGALRVFVSRVTDDDARLSVNGDMVTLTPGRTAPAMIGEESCRVALDSVDRGHVQVSAICGEAVAVSDPAGPGQTIRLGDDGAIRVFVSKITDDGMVRFAVNGQDTVTAAAGQSVDIGEGCSVTVEDIEGRSATFSQACGG